ncbi:hypothetical protein [uncultured Ferrovibrio sp.]|jgi:hypothetical protein|uniref:hypothetical protein n=1 Tax=uncultured Ferrovibrio sp. TaxID=1576913 RepID=UPI00262516FA|nr:hypothetical protein [uncultured Ferrovibrio sp.]
MSLFVPPVTVLPQAQANPAQGLAQQSQAPNAAQAAAAVTAIPVRADSRMATTASGQSSDSDRAKKDKGKNSDSEANAAETKTAHYRPRGMGRNTDLSV